MTEVWKDIEGFEGRYQVSNLGEVRSLDQQCWNGHVFFLKRGRVLKQKMSTSGYMRVSLGKDNDRYVHRLVAGAFLPNADGLPQVNHKDENKLNNRVENLEWCTSLYNMHYGNAVAVREEKLKRTHISNRRPVINLSTGTVYPSVTEAADKEGVHFMSISSCIRGKAKSAGGHRFAYYKEAVIRDAR